jgi:hypothetical protein
VPYQYDWNPAVLSKLVLRAGKEAATGGFRLGPFILGYIAFGWIGVFLFAMLDGYLTGTFVSALRNYLRVGRHPPRDVLGVLFQVYFWNFVGSIYGLSIDTVVATILLWWILGLRPFHRRFVVTLRELNPSSKLRSARFSGGT